MIEIEGITKRYDATTVVDDVSMVVEPRTVCVIVGTSGSGKTTLLRMINRLVEPTAGVIKLDGNDNRSLPGYELRRSIGYAIQGHGLFPHRTVAQNIATVPVLLGWDKDRIKARVDELMTLYQLDPEAYGPRYPHELSGGQLQRVAIARALISRPALLVADEPVSMIDASLRASIVNLLRGLCVRTGVSIIYITHDLATAYSVSDRILIMRLGKVVESGPARTVLDDPQHEYSRLLKSSVLSPEVPSNGAFFHA